MPLCLEREKEHFLSRRDDQGACSGNRTSPSFGHRAPRGLSRDQLVLTVSCCFVKQLSPAVCRATKESHSRWKGDGSLRLRKEKRVVSLGVDQGSGTCLEKSPFPSSQPTHPEVYYTDHGQWMREQQLREVRAN